MSPPAPAEYEEQEEEDEEEVLGDLKSNDLMQFAYQIATGMVWNILYELYQAAFMS